MADLAGMLKQEARTAIAQCLGVDASLVDELLAPPSKAGAGDLALPCFRFGKDSKRKPNELAEELAQHLGDTLAGVEAEAAGPFLNLRFAPQTVAQRLLPLLDKDPLSCLRLERSDTPTVCIDFSSPNIAKHLAFHHIRSTMLGNALARCYRAAGWQAVRINFLGDWGTAFGRLIAGWKREGHELAELEAAADKVAFLNALYVRISQAAEADQSVADEARQWSRRLETGDAEARRLWQAFKDASLAEFHKVYRLLDVDFDSWKGEAHYEGRMQDVVEQLRKADLLQEDDGAEVVDLSAAGLKKPCLIKRADGGTLYATRDLAACDDRWQEYRFDRSLYVVDLGQSLHFKEWFAVAGLLGKPYADHLRHVGFGVVLMWNEEQGGWAKTATRKGVPMLLMDVLHESIQRAEAIIAEKNPELAADQRRAVAQAVGVGAVVFNDLKNSRKSDVKFRFDDALNMQGDTGPYLQYAHARLCSIERKFAEQYGAPQTPDPLALQRDDEKAVLLQIARLPNALSAVVEHDEPHHLAVALLELAATLSTWISAGGKDPSARVLCDDPTTAHARLALVRIVRSTLGEGLHLLGLQAPERM